MMVHRGMVGISRSRRRARSRHGFTLVEIILAMMLLSLLAAGFLTIFSNGFLYVFSGGRRTSAVVDAQATMDLLYTRDFEHPDDIAAFLASLGLRHQDPADISVHEGNDTNFCVGPERLLAGTNGCEVTLLVFYDTEDPPKHTTLTVFIPLREG